MLMKALLTGLAMQRRLDPGTVSDDLAIRGLSALVGLDADLALSPPSRGGPGTRAIDPDSRLIEEQTQGATS